MEDSEKSNESIEMSKNERIDTISLKEELLSGLLDNGKQNYMSLMKLYFSYKLTREELANSLQSLLNDEQLKLHNRLIGAILHNASCNERPPITNQVPLPVPQGRLRKSYVVKNSDSLHGDQRYHSALSKTPNFRATGKFCTKGPVKALLHGAIKPKSTSQSQSIVSNRGNVSIQTEVGHSGSPSEFSRIKALGSSVNHPEKDGERDNLSGRPKHQGLERNKRQSPIYPETPERSDRSIALEAQLFFEKEELRLYEKLIARSEKKPIIPPVDASFAHKVRENSDIVRERPGNAAAPAVDDLDLSELNPFSITSVQCRMKRAAWAEGGIHGIREDAAEVLAHGLQEHLKSILAASLKMRRGVKRSFEESDSVEASPVLLTARDFRNSLEFHKGRTQRNVGRMFFRLDYI